MLFVGGMNCLCGKLFSHLMRHNIAHLSVSYSKQPDPVWVGHLNQRFSFPNFQTGAGAHPQGMHAGEREAP